MSRAVALLLPGSTSDLRDALDPDRDDADLLEDGSILLTARAAFGDAAHGRVLLAAYGPELTESHADPRGVLVFPERFYPIAREYDGVVASVEATGVWVPSSSPDERRAEDDARRRTSARRARRRARAGAPVLAPFRETLGPSSAAKESLERLREMFQRAHVVAAMGWLTTSDVLLFRTRLPLPRRALFRGGTRVLHHQVLPDGTTMVIVDIKGVRKRDVVAHVLATSTRVRPWLADHDDRRGVPYLRSRDVDRLVRARTYEEALALAGEVSFVQPQAREEQEEERKARLRRALGEA